jgi:5'-3' exonuclease
VQGGPGSPPPPRGGGSSKKGKRPRQASVVSSTALTPGTPFMHDVCVSCSYYVCAKLASQRWQHVSAGASLRA